MNNRQYGFTMIELLISMLLGMSLIAGVSVLFTNSQTVYKTQRSLGYMMEDGRYVLETLSKELRRTGFLRNATALNGAANNIFRLDDGSNTATTSTDVTGVLGSGINPSSNSRINMAIGEYVHGVSTPASATVTGVGNRATATDDFVIRYQLNDYLDADSNNSDPKSNTSSPCSQNLDFLSTEVYPSNHALYRNMLANDTSADLTLIPPRLPPVPHVATLYFYVANDSNNIPTLYCQAKRETITAGVPPIDIGCKAPNTNCTDPDALPIISNVERLIVKYGIDSDLTPDGAANYYVSATTLNTPITSTTLCPASITGGTVPYDSMCLLKKVVAIKLFVVLRSEDDNISKKAGTFSIDGVLCSASTYPCPATTNRRLYRVFSTTIAFRNEIL
jgi:type IV pilus assembly protein PilW